MIEKVVDLLSILKNDYCSKNYIEGLFSSYQRSMFPQTPANISKAKKSRIPTFSSNNSRPKNPQINPLPRKPNSIIRQSPASMLSKPTHKRHSTRKKKNRSLKAVSTKTHKKKKISESKSRSRKHNKMSGSPYSYQEGKNSRYMNALKYINPNDPGRFWLTGTLGKASRIRKDRKKSNSLNMKKKEKEELSLSNLNNNCETYDFESVWGCGSKHNKKSQISKVTGFGENSNF
jgi:hypothetical protein